MDAALPSDTSALGNLVAIVLRISRSTGVWTRRPLFRSGAETSSHGISPDTIHLRCELNDALVSSQPMIEITSLPDDLISVFMKMFPVFDDFAHRFVAPKK